MNGKIDTVDVARPRQVHSNFFSNATGTRRKNYYTIAEASCLADVVRDKHDCFVPRFPDSLKVSIELLTSERIESSKRLVHRAARADSGASARASGDALLHSTRQLVNVGTFEPAEADQFEVVLGNVLPILFVRFGLSLSPNRTFPTRSTTEQSRFLKHDEPLATGAGYRFAISLRPFRYRVFRARQ